MKVLIATKNPAKIKGAQSAFDEFFKDVVIEGYSVPSGVPDQPVNLDTYNGANNRVDNLINLAKENNISADYYIAIESGITNSLGKWIITNIAVIKDNNGKVGFGTSAGFPVPESLVDEIISTDLGKVIDRIFNENNLRAGAGGISLISKGVITRSDLTHDAFVMALTPFIGDNWYEYTEKHNNQ